jgi:hypothetical protein
LFAVLDRTLVSMDLVLLKRQNLAVRVVDDEGVDVQTVEMRRLGLIADWGVDRRIEAQVQGREKTQESSASRSARKSAWSWGVSIRHSLIDKRWIRLLLRLAGNQRQHRLHPKYGNKTSLGACRPLVQVHGSEPSWREHFPPVCARFGRSAGPFSFYGSDQSAL